MTSLDGSHRRIRETSQKFDTRFKEQVASFRTSSYNLKFVQHLLENGYATDPMEDIMEV